MEINQCFMVIQEMIIGLKRNNTELRYDRYVRALEMIEKKSAKKVKQILEVKQRLRIE